MNDKERYVEFNNKVYKTLVEDLIKDAFYNDGSLRGKIALIRQYSEVIVRKILNISHQYQERVTLGDKDIIHKLKEISNNNVLLMNSLEIIKNNGNACIHTQKIEKPTEEDMEKCIDSLFNLYACLFILYFEKYQFGKTEKIASHFSILPPIIRYKTLEYLYNKDKDNITLIDKLVLSILKSFDEKKAIQWVNDRKNVLESMSCVSEKAYLDLSKKLGSELANKIVEQGPKNMYILCNEKIDEVSKCITKNGGVLYNDFESAIDFYKEKGHIQGDDKEILEFNSIMEFCYLGRESIKNNKLKDIDKYIVMTFTE